MSFRSTDLTRTGAALVIGEALMDLVVTAANGGEPAAHPGGAPANVALGLARLGASVRLRTALGRDAHGEAIAAHLGRSGVAIDEESWSLPRTSSALARIDESGAATYAFDILWDVEVPDLGDAAVVHVGSVGAFLPTARDAVGEIVRAARGRSIVSFDPNIRPRLLPDRVGAVARFEALAAESDVIKLSDEDAAWLYPGLEPGDLLDRLVTSGPRLVAITCGGQGAMLASPHARVGVEAPQVKVRDTVGAGDTFMAAMLAELLRDRALLEGDEDALEHLGAFAATAAAITVQRAGADLPHRADVELAQRLHAVRRCVSASFLACTA